MRIIDHTIAPAAPVQPVAPAPALHGGPPMPWTVREAEAHGGHIIRFKLYSNGMTGDLLVAEDEAVLARVTYLEARVAYLQNENEALRGSLAVFAASEPVAVEELVSPLPPEIETAVVQEVAVSLSAEARAAWAEGLIDRLPRRVPLGTSESGVGATADGRQLPGGFVELAPAAVPMLAPVVVPTETAVPDVGTGDDAGVGTETAAPKTAKRLVVEAALRAAPHLSNAVLAEQCDVSDEFVRKARKALEADGSLEPVASVVGRDGNAQSVATKAVTDAA